MNLLWWLRPKQTRLKILRAIASKPLPGVEVGRAIGVGIGSLYPTLNEMEQEGLITSYLDEKRLEERGGARRRFYGITRLGRRKLEEGDRSV
jgi:DNA-binding PadR family transcriptional regulator